MGKGHLYMDLDWRCRPRGKDMIQRSRVSLFADPCWKTRGGDRRLQVLGQDFLECLGDGGWGEREERVPARVTLEISGQYGGEYMVVDSRVSSGGAIQSKAGLHSAAVPPACKDTHTIGKSCLP